MKIYTFLLSETVNIWHLELLPCLKSMGHETYTPAVGLDEYWDRQRSGRWSFKHRKRLDHLLLEDVKRVKAESGVDLFFAEIFPFQFSPHIFKEIESFGVPTVLFYCDNLQSYEIREKFAPYFTITWVPEKEAVKLYENQRINYIYLPMAANPDFNKPLHLEEKRPVVFIGTKNPYRRWLLGSALIKQLPLEIFGNYWHPGVSYYELAQPSRSKTYSLLSQIERFANYIEKRRNSLRMLLRYGLQPRIAKARMRELGKEYEALVSTHACQDPISYQRVQELYAEARVTLGINDGVDPIGRQGGIKRYSKARDFEAPMSGACYLTQHTEELDQFYPEEGIITTYRSVDDLCEKANRLLRDKRLRDQMRQKGRAYCIAHHTWQHRFRELFKRMGLR